MLRIISYNGQDLTDVAPAELLDAVKKLDVPNSMLWIDISNPSTDEEQLVFRDCLPIHPLALSDIRRGLRVSAEDDIHHPKVEEFPDYLLVIAHSLELRKTIPTDDVHKKTSHIVTSQLSAVVTKQLLITHHPGELQSIEQSINSCVKNPKLMSKGPDYILHLALDNVVDMYIEVSNHIETKVESLEGVVLKEPNTRTLLRLLQLRRTLQEFRRTIQYLREMVYRLSRGEFSLVSIEESVYYRNVYDHLVRVHDQVETVRESVSGLVEVYFSVTSARLNNVMKVLTVISTIFLPITFITSFYGMNFRHMPELGEPWAYPAVIVLIVTISVIMIFSFKRRGWLD